MMGGNKVGHPISPGEAGERFGEVRRKAWESQEMASVPLWLKPLAQAFGSSCRFGSKSSIRLTNVFSGWLG